MAKAPSPVTARDLPCTDLVLLAALLERRFPHLEVVLRSGKIQVGDLVYRAAATPSVDDVAACAADIAPGRQVVLLVPCRQVDYTRGIAAGLKVEERLNVWGSEQYVSCRVLDFSIATGIAPEATAADLRREWRARRRRLASGATGRARSASV
jgi:hypothetical protein